VTRHGGFSGEGPAPRSSRDRAIGALVGLAVGDAVGTTLEFESPGSFEPITDMVGGGPFGLEPGQWTDDTSMAMCLAESILDRDALDPEDQLRRYLAWRDHGYWSSTGECFDIGTTTTAAISRFATTGVAIPDAADVDQGRAANGSLMRLAPVPIRWSADPASAAQHSGESSRTTHPADRPVDACRAFGAMIAALIAGVAAEEVLAPDFWTFGALDPRVEAVVRGSWRTGCVRGSGYVVDALESALWAVGRAGEFRGAVLRAANLGDDADTTAAIAGQLAGARWGWTGIPEDWRNRITHVDRIVAIAGRLHDAARGSVPSLKWPHDRFVHGYWVAPGEVLAGEYPGADDPVSAAAKVNLLVDYGVRTFVDLTTTVDGLEPYQRHVDEAAASRGLEVVRVHHPIPDMGVREVSGYDEILATVRDARAAGAVYVHCWGGIGRTATVVGCLLVDEGMTAEQALERIDEIRSVTRKARSAAPQTQAQRDVIRRRANG